MPRLAESNPVTLKGLLELPYRRYDIQPLEIVHYNAYAVFQHFKGEVDLCLGHPHGKVVPLYPLALGVPQVTVNVHVGGKPYAVSTIRDRHHDEQVLLLEHFFPACLVCYLARHQTESD